MTLEQGMQAIEAYRCRACDGHGWWKNVAPYKPFDEFPDEWPLVGHFEYGEWSIDDGDDTYSDTEGWLYVWGENAEPYEELDYRREDDQRDWFESANRLLRLSQQGIRVCTACGGDGIVIDERSPKLPEWGDYAYEERFLNHDYVQEVRFGYDGYDG